MKPTTKRKKTAAEIANAPRHSANVRLSEREHTMIAADIADMVRHGAPAPSLGMYCKHGAMSYARLRRIEAALRAVIHDPQATSEEQHIAERCLTVSG